MSSLELTEDKLREILKSNGIHDPVSEIVLKDPPFAGENFGGQVKLCKVKFASSEKKPLNLFIKVITNNESHLQMLEGCRLFVKESTFFTQYLPAAREFCKAMGQEKLIDIYPKCYYGDKNLIVLENLVLDKGFVMFEREDFHDFERTKYVHICIPKFFQSTNYKFITRGYIRVGLTALARHHAISQAFIENTGGPEAFFLRFPDLNFDGLTAPWSRMMLGGMVENAVARLLDIFQDANIDGTVEIVEFLKSMQGKCFDDFHSAIKVTPKDENDLLVIIHGDFHNNNIMFKKDPETGKAQSAMLIDLQGPRHMSPCVDIHSYMAISVQPLVRRERLRDLLQAYLDVFTETMSMLGYPSRVTIERLVSNYHDKRMFGFWFSVMMENGIILKVMKTMKPDEVSEMHTKMDEYIKKWLQENPEERVKHVQAFLDTFREYSPTSN